MSDRNCSWLAGEVVANNKHIAASQPNPLLRLLLTSRP